jgi:hypothetical protein
MYVATADYKLDNPSICRTFMAARYMHTRQDKADYRLQKTVHGLHCSHDHPLTRPPLVLATSLLAC